MCKINKNINTGAQIKMYGGFFTEEAKDKLADLINLLDLLSMMTGIISEGNGDFAMENDRARSVFNVLLRELTSINAGLDDCNRSFLWCDVQLAGITKNNE